MDNKDIKPKEEPMMHPTREQFDAAFERIHDKLDANKDHFNEKMNELNTEVTEIRTRVDMTPVVTIPERPCPFFKDHEDEHKKIKDSWTRPLIVGGILTLLLFIQEPIKHFFKGMFDH